VNVGVECVQQRRGEVTGVAPGDVEEDWLGSLRNRASGGNQMMRQSWEMGLGHKRERGTSLPRRNRAEIPAGMRGSGEEFRQPCGD
jgi:hypothetical protein